MRARPLAENIYKVFYEVNSENGRSRPSTVALNTLNVSFLFAYLKKVYRPVYMFSEQCSVGALFCRPLVGRLTGL